MSERPESASARPATWLALGALALAAACGNVINDDSGGAVQQLADALAEYGGAPRITDETLSKAIASITRRAEEGDVEAALVLFELAARQRASE